MTGEYANHLATYLSDVENIDVQVVHVQGDYQGGIADLKPVGEIHQVRSWYNGKQKIRRLLASFIESFTLIRKAKSVCNGPFIIMTDPPFLSYWASIFLKRRKWMLWSMDIYPNAFVSNGLVKKSNPLYRLLHTMIYNNPPDQIIALGPLQKIYLEKGYKQERKGCQLPCGIYDYQKTEDAPAWYAGEELIHFGYCGNLGEAHSPEFLVECLKRLDPKRHRLVLAVYGSKAEVILKQAENHPAVVLVGGGVQRNELPFIDIHLVSLKAEWNHVCVPSKAVSAVCSRSAFLFCGDRNCDNWHLLGDAGWFISDDGNMKDSLDDFFESLSESSMRQKKVRAMEVVSRLKEMESSAYKYIGKAIRELQS